MLEILKNNIKTNIIYDSLIKESHKVFSKFSDDDFFSDKVQHIYFYSEINDDSVSNLQKLLFNASKTKINNSGIQISPKPIVIHLNSGGGYVSSTEKFYTIIQSIRVPLCIIIENLCASAATDLALLSPYRVIIDYSQYMIHDSFGGNIVKGSNKVKSEFPSLYIIIYYIELLKKRTKLTDEEIKIFIERDILIDPDYCLKKNIVDRILNFPKINNPEFYSNVSNLQLNLTSFLKKTNLNHIYIDNDEINNNNDIIIDSNNFTKDINEVKNLNDLSIFLDNNFIIKKDNSKPIIIHFNSKLAFSIADANSNPLNLTQFNYRLAMIQ